MSGEPDSGTGPGGSGVKLESPINNNNNEDTECDKVSASTTNFESKDGLKILQCERCGEFETISVALLLVHVAQCNPSNRGETENHNDTNSNDQQSASEANKQSRKLFECDVCNMKFSNGANMRRHKMRHTGVKPYECRVCQKRFFRKDHLAEHFTTHTKTLPYHCPICNRGFQRQIAMRAHFQNEHVGQHDLVKTCPLCSYRAGTMKSLRVHFFNRHGIDLDNPGPNAPSSLLLALDPQNAGSYLAAVAAASANAANQQPNYSDSGDSLRSADNATPPMHFLTPHVEISMADDSNFKPDQGAISVSSALEIKPCLSNRMNGSPASPHSADSNSNIPSSSQSLIGNVIQNSRHLLVDGQITPSISLIPIKQEPSNDDYNDSSQRKTDGPKDDASSAAVAAATPPNNSHTTNSTDTINSTPSSSLTSLIKVSPLKSLLREDLKRRISARASNRATRNTTNNSQQNSITVTPETTPSATTTSNGTITSTGPETELIPTSRKRMLQCLFCGIEFPDQTLYFLHKGCHSESNPWKCNICGEQMNNVYDFNSHLLSKSHQ